MRNLICAIALAATFAGTASSAAQVYPTRPITLIVPYAAGGPGDVMARIVTAHMSRTLSQRLIIENVVGAGGTIASTRTMRAKPDGYTVEQGTLGTHAAAVGFYPSLAHRPDVDFEPIGLVGEIADLIVGRKDLPPNDLKEFISYARANPEKLNVGHAGVGSGTHLSCLLLGAVLGVKPTMVPFNGSAPAMNAVIAGQVDYTCGAISDVIPQLQGGTIKVYAIGTTERSPALPNVPTAKEAGLPEFQASTWNALFAPRGTPKPILGKLADALDKALDDETTRKRLIDIGVDVPDKARRGREPLAALVKSEIARWTPIIKAAGIKGE